MPFEPAPTDTSVVQELENGGWELRREEAQIFVSKPGVGSYCAGPDDGNIAAEVLYHLANTLLSSPHLQTHLGGNQTDSLLDWMREVERELIWLSGMKPSPEMRNAASALRQKITGKKWKMLQQIAVELNRGTL